MRIVCCHVRSAECKSQDLNVLDHFLCASHASITICDVHDTMCRQCIGYTYSSSLIHLNSSFLVRLVSKVSKHEFFRATKIRWLSVIVHHENGLKKRKIHSHRNYDCSIPIGNPWLLKIWWLSLIFHIHRPDSTNSWETLCSSCRVRHPIGWWTIIVTMVWRIKV